LRVGRYQLDDNLFEELFHNRSCHRLGNLFDYGGSGLGGFRRGNESFGNDGSRSRRGLVLFPIKLHLLSGSRGGAADQPFIQGLAGGVGVTGGRRRRFTPAAG